MIERVNLCLPNPTLYPSAMVFLLILVLSFGGAMAQEPIVPTLDTPIGAPYRTAETFRGTMESPIRDTISVRDYLSTRLDALRSELMAIIDERDKRYGQRFEAQQTAIDKALSAIDRRLEGVNEFRLTLTDQQKTLVSKDAADARFASLDEKITGNDVAIAQLDNRIVQLTSRGAGIGDAWGYLIGFFLLVSGGLAILAFFRKPATK